MPWRGWVRMCEASGRTRRTTAMSIRARRERRRPDCARDHWKRAEMSRRLSWTICVARMTKEKVDRRRRIGREVNVDDEARVVRRCLLMRTKRLAGRGEKGGVRWDPRIGMVGDLGERRRRVSGTKRKSTVPRAIMAMPSSIGGHDDHIMR